MVTHTYIYTTHIYIPHKQTHTYMHTEEKYNTLLTDELGGVGQQDWEKNNC